MRLNINNRKMSLSASSVFLRMVAVAFLVAQVYAFGVEAPPNNRKLASFAPFSSTSNPVAIFQSADNDDSGFPALDAMLARARKRQISPLLRVQAFLDAPLVNSAIVITRADATFTMAAFAIGAKGFAIGLLLGKWTSSKLPRQQEWPPIFTQLYPVLLAIVLDQVLTR
jgi:hypothetical protein